MTDDLKQQLVTKLKSVQRSEAYWTRTKLWFVCLASVGVMLWGAWSVATGESPTLRYSGTVLAAGSAVQLVLFISSAQRARDLRPILETIIVLTERDDEERVPPGAAGGL